LLQQEQVVPEEEEKLKNGEREQDASVEEEASCTTSVEQWRLRAEACELEIKRLAEKYEKGSHSEYINKDADGYGVAVKNNSKKKQAAQLEKWSPQDLLILESWVAMLNDAKYNLKEAEQALETTATENSNSSHRSDKLKELQDKKELFSLDSCLFETVEDYVPPPPCRRRGGRVVSPRSKSEARHALGAVLAQREEARKNRPSIKSFMMTGGAPPSPQAPPREGGGDSSSIGGEDSSSSIGGGGEEQLLPTARAYSGPTSPPQREREDSPPKGGSAAGFQIEISQKSQKKSPRTSSSVKNTTSAGEKNRINRRRRSGGHDGRSSSTRARTNNRRNLLAPPQLQTSSKPKRAKVAPLPPIAGGGRKQLQQHDKKSRQKKHEKFDKRVTLLPTILCNFPKGDPILTEASVEGQNWPQLFQKLQSLDAKQLEEIALRDEREEIIRP